MTIMGVCWWVWRCCAACETRYKSDTRSLRGHCGSHHHNAPYHWISCNCAEASVVCVVCVSVLQLIVYKMKPKKHYRRKNGHRQELTKFRVTKLGSQ